MRTLFFISLLSGAAVALAGDLAFEPNQGQSAPQVRYLARTAQGVLFLSDDEMILRRDGVVRFQLIGSSRNARWEPLGSPIGDTSYFVGRDESRWARHVPSYSRLARRGIYKGVDAIYYGSAGLLEYDFIVAPRGDPAQIRFSIEGADRIAINDRGDLVIEAAGGNLRQRKPELYQTGANGERQPVEGAFRRIDGKTIGFTVGKYDRTRPLAIDPVILASTYLGGSGDDAIFATNGTQVVAMTASADFPGVQTPVQRLHHNIALTNVQVSSNSYGQGPTGTAVYGGSGDDVITAASVFGGWGNPWFVVTGYTNSQDLPTVLSISYYDSAQNTAWMIDYGGGASDGFILATDGAVSNVTHQPDLFLTYFGGPGDDRINGFGVYGSEVMFVGSTTQPGFVLPATVPTTMLGPGGGVDGFLGFSYLAEGDTLLFSLSYFGGTGDDHALGVSYAYKSIAISGDTNSTDFPLSATVQGQVNGTTDAFVAIPQFDMNNLVTGLTGTLFGGSGADSATQVAALANGNFVIGGNTSSTDLQLKSPIQVTYGGGTSDAFIAQYSPDLKELISSTYIGGSGGEQLNVLAVDPQFGTLSAGGSTSSPDFPVNNAVQPQFGGGPDDGFLLQFDPGLNLVQSTYLGGSGSDQVLGLYLPGYLMVIATGKTSSPDFPIVAPSQAGLNGTANGFLTRIGMKTWMLPSQLLGGLDLRNVAGIAVGDGSTLTGITAISSDPSTVVLAANLTDPGAASITPPSGGFAFDCLTDHGGADITISAPGFPNAMTHVSCYPASIGLTVSPSTRSTAQSTVVQVGQTFETIYVSFNAVSPSGSEAYDLAVRPGASISITFSSSNPAVATVRATQTSSTIVIQPNSGVAASLNLLAVGTADITAALSDGTTQTLTLQVVSPLGVTSPLLIPSGYECAEAYFASGPGLNATVTLTSQNPDMLLITADPGTAGSPSMTAPGPGYVQPTYLQAVGPLGTASLTISATGFDTVTVPVQITAPLAVLTLENRFSTQFHPGDQVQLAAGVTPQGSGQFCLSNPGTPSMMGVSNTNPTMLSGLPAAIDLSKASGALFGSINGAGTATVSLQPPPGVIANPSTSSITIVSRDRPLSLPDTVVGNNLEAPVTVALPYSASSNASVTITSSNPSLVLLRTSANQTGSAQITLTAAPLAFFVQGLASSGTATITADAGSLGKATATVTLTPSGWAWTSTSYATVLYSPSPSTVNFTTYSLDPATLQPRIPQPMRPGLTVPVVNFSNDNSGVVTATSQTQGAVTLSFSSAGSATLTLQTPDGFQTPSLRTAINVSAGTPSLGLNSTAVGFDQQASWNVATPTSSPAAGPYTLSSADPSRLLVSSDPKATGAASATSPTGVFYLQALSAGGFVKITATAPGFNSATAIVTLTGSAFALTTAVYTGSSGSIPDPTGTDYLTTTQSPVTIVTINVIGVDAFGTPIPGSGVLRPGIQNVPAILQSSNPSVGIIKETSLSVAAGSSYTTATFQPLTLGQTDITVVQPPGFTPPTSGSKVTFTVTQPAFTGQPITMAKDTIQQMSVQLPNYITPPTTNLNVTITSSDPTKILLSADNLTAAPTATLNTVLIGGQTSLPAFYVQALAGSGSASVNISAPGYATASIPVTLTPASVSFNSTGPIQSLIDQPGTGYVALSGNPRPGASPSITIQSSDPTIVVIDTPQVQFSSGSSQALFKYRTVGIGTATLSLVLPDGYVAGQPSSIVITVTAPALFFPDNALPVVAQDSRILLDIRGDAAFPPGLPLTVTSSDPTKLLIGDTPDAIGQGTMVINAQAGINQDAYCNALAGSGTVTVSVSAPGYAPGSVQVSLVPSAAVFSTTSLTTAINQGQQVTVQFVQLSPATLMPNGRVAVRPGATLTVGVKSSDSNIVQVSTTSVTLTSSSDQPTITLTPLAAGTALVSLGTLPGGVTPASGSQLVVNVSH